MVLGMVVGMLIAQVVSLMGTGGWMCLTKPAIRTNSEGTFEKITLLLHTRDIWIKGMVKRIFQVLSQTQNNRAEIVFAKCHKASSHL